MDTVIGIGVFFLFFTVILIWLVRREERRQRHVAAVEFYKNAAEEMQKMALGMGPLTVSVNQASESIKKLGEAISRSVVR